MKHKLLSKKANAAIGKAITVITAVVLGGAIMVGGAGVIKHTVMPTTTTKVNSMFGMSGDAAGGSGGTGGGSMGDDVTPVTELKRNGIIPEGGVYYKGGEMCFICLESYGVKELGVCHNGYCRNSNSGFSNEATAKYIAGEPFPTTVEDGDIYIEGDYEYSYSTQAYPGWHVSVKAEKTSYGEILSEINGKPVTSMCHTFYGNKTIVTSPKIPSSVTYMAQTFYGCTSLAGSIEINANVAKSQNMNETFYDTTKQIVLSGSATNLLDFAKSANNNNVKAETVIPQGVTYYKGGQECDYCLSDYGIKGMKHINFADCPESFKNEPTATYTEGQKIPLLIERGDICVKDEFVYIFIGGKWFKYNKSDAF